MKIETYLTCAGVAPSHLKYSATEENYDGAPDADLPSRLIGMGPTPEAATADLLEQLEDFDPDWRDHYGTIESAECNMLRSQDRQNDIIDDVFRSQIISPFEPAEMTKIPYVDPDQE